MDIRSTRGANHPRFRPLELKHSRREKVRSVTYPHGDISTRPTSLPDGLRSVRRVELTRRRFAAKTAKLGILVATISGGIVGFAPSAEAVVNCIPGTRHLLAGPGSCNTSCIGPCAYHETCCNYDTRETDLFCCYCLICYYPSRPVVKCLHSGSYGCCVAC